MLKKLTKIHEPADYKLEPESTMVTQLKQTLLLKLEVLAEASVQQDAE